MNMLNRQISFDGQLAQKFEDHLLGGSFIENIQKKSREIDARMNRLRDDADSFMITEEAESDLSVSLDSEDETN